MTTRSPYRTKNALEIIEGMRASRLGADTPFHPELDEDLLPELAELFERGGLNPSKPADWQLAAVALSHFLSLGKGGPVNFWTPKRKRDLLMRVYAVKVEHSELQMSEILRRVRETCDTYSKHDPASLYARFYSALAALKDLVNNNDGSKQDHEMLVVLSQKKSRSSKPA